MSLNKALENLLIRSYFLMVKSESAVGSIDFFLSSSNILDLLPMNFFDFWSSCLSFSERSKNNYYWDLAEIGGGK